MEEKTFVEQLDELGLVDLMRYGDGIVCEMRYATEYNLLARPMYAHQCCYVQKSVADALNRVQANVRSSGVGLKVWDAYRPVSVHGQIVAYVNNVDYTPTSSTHSKGIAVDLTLINLQTGRELEMPTVYDELTEAAHQNAQVANQAAYENREFLKVAMQAEGFSVHPFKWWHYDYLYLTDVEALDIAI